MNDLLKDRLGQAVDEAVCEPIEPRADSDERVEQMIRRFSKGVGYASFIGTVALIAVMAVR